jgi:hypothetical protein
MKRCSGTAQDIFVLDSAFALIEAHPPMFIFREAEQQSVRELD